MRGSPPGRRGCRARCPSPAARVVWPPPHPRFPSFCFVQIVMAVFSWIYYSNYVARGGAQAVAGVMSAALKLPPLQQVRGGGASAARAGGRAAGAGIGAQCGRACACSQGPAPSCRPLTTRPPPLNTAGGDGAPGQCADRAGDAAVAAGQGDSGARGASAGGRMRRGRAPRSRAPCSSRPPLVLSRPLRAARLALTAPAPFAAPGLHMHPLCPYDPRCTAPTMPPCLSERPPL